MKYLGIGLLILGILSLITVIISIIIACFMLNTWFGLCILGIIIVEICIPTALILIDY